MSWQAGPVRIVAGSSPSDARPVAGAAAVGRADAAVPPRLLVGAAMVAVVLAWGFGPPVSKLISAPAFVAVFFRMWLSVPILLAWLYGTGHRLSTDLLRATAPAGVLFGLNMCCVFSAFHHASIATLSVMSALQPGLVLVVAGPFLGERPTGWHRLWTGVGIGGAVLVIVGAGSAVRSSALGVALSAGALCTFTAYFLITRVARARAARPIDAIEWMCGVTIFSALTVTPMALATSSSADFGAVGGRDWLWLAFAVIVTGIAGHVMMAWVLRHIEASKASLYVLTMNVVAVSAAWPIHHEPLTVLQALGGVVVLGAVAAVISRPAAPAAALG
ncbi:MAG: DMT family transporter [Acidimicrobiales bacterium]